MSRRERIWSSSGVTFVVLALITVLAGVTTLKQARPHPLAVASGHVFTQGASQPEFGRTEPLTLRRTGFEQTEITLEAGRSRLEVRDQTGLADVVLRLANANGSFAREGHTGRERPYWRLRGGLPPGDYLLTAASHPEWVCRVRAISH